jgi:diguanylate cyclase (GGDEF)-like protein/PAS domain S-box-containing protein
LPGLLFTVTNILWLSVLLQVIAAYLALRLIPITGKALAWIILSIAFLLMATRRAISLLHQHDIIEGVWLAAVSSELVALTISVLILIGVILLSRVFDKQQQDSSELRKLSQVVDQNSNSTLITDLEGHVEYVNSHFTEMLGYSLDEIKGEPSSILKSNVTSQEVITDLWNTISHDEVWTGEMGVRCKDASICWIKARVSAVKDKDGQMTHYVAVLEDVGEKRAQQVAMEYLTTHDALTNLPNRSYFFQDVHKAISTAKSQQQSLAVMMIDLNQFKIINDTLGHQTGDMLLKKIARRLQLAIKSIDTVGRMGGDEFLVLLRDVDENVALHIAERMREAVSAPIEVDDRNFEVSMSIGVALFPDHGLNPDILIQRADVAMYTAKTLTGGVAVYESSQDENTLGRLNLLADISQALIANEFQCYYQPRVNLETQAIEGVEALIRWFHPKQGLLLPDKFIPLLEDTGNITAITHWVLEQAISQLALWQKTYPLLTLSINISTKDLQDSRLVSLLAELVLQYKIAVPAIILEITESALMSYTHHSQDTLTSLEHLGVQLAIDDYGTGYSSLSYLKEMPITELKIDKSFIMNMNHNEDDAVIVRSTIDLGQNLGLHVIAEGVENEETRQALLQLNCKSAQGFYFSKPVNSDALSALLLKQSG